MKWPASGEIDVMEAGHSEGISTNRQNTTFGGALHWEHNDSYAGYGTKEQSSTPLNEKYHVYTVEWDDKVVKMFLDDNTSPYFVMNVNGSDAEEFRDYPMYLIFNLAVGGSFTGIYDKEEITAPMPANMYVDYVRVYQKEGNGELSTNPPVSSSLAVFADDSDLENTLEIGFDTNIEALGTSERTGESPKEGNEVLSYNLMANVDYNISFISLATKNLSTLTQDGSLDFYVKTNSFSDIQVGLKDTLGSEKWITLNDSSKYNCQRDETWSRVIIPLNEFSEVDFAKIDGVFMIKGTPESDSYISIDRVIISNSVVNSELYGIYTNNPNITENFVIDNTNGYLYIWENTLKTMDDAPEYEGEDVLAFTSESGKNWFGFGLFSKKGIDLTQFADGYLKLALRTNSSNDFWIGVSGANNTEAKIDFKTGNDPYGFVRDGQWHRITIPVNDLLKKGLDLSSCDNIFMLGGAPTINNILVDDIYFSVSEEDFENRFINPDRNNPLSTDIQKITADYYRIYSENTNIPDFFEIDNKKGHIYIWDNSLREIAGGTPYDGTEQLSFKSGNLGWYGFGIFSDHGLDLTHFANGFLTLSIKTSSDEDFWIGIQGDENTEGKISFSSGSRINIDRDNNWHRVTIPINKLTAEGLKLENCGNIFMLGGNYISDIAVDDIILSTNTTLPENPNLNVSTSVQHNDMDILQVYPIPMKDYLNLRTGVKLSWIEIYNQSGALIYNEVPADEISIKVNTQNFSPGVYLLRVVLDDNKILTKKIIKK